MDATLLADLQRRTAYPSITILADTTPRSTADDADCARLGALVDEADRRLEGDVDAEQHQALVAELRRLVVEVSRRCTSRAVAICVSPGHSAVVTLGRAVAPRVVIDHTFATRDLVAELNRTARYYVVTVSDSLVRLHLGDRHRVVERSDDLWPLTRDPDDSPRLWKASIAAALDHQLTSRPMPVVLAGVQRSITHLVERDHGSIVGTIPGNHDRTRPAELHTLAWPLVVDWLRQDGSRALERLDRARSERRFAGGIDEVWSLAEEGRVELLAVEEGYHLAARVDGHRIEPVDDPTSPGVVDDVVDELIEQVMRTGGRVVMVSDDELDDHQRVAAVLRY